MSAHFVGPALDSLLSQACADFELIVVDDGSTDETAAILHAYAKRDARIRFLRNETNRGLIFTRNRALQESRGRYVAIADADDLFHPQRFEKQLQFLRDHPACGVVGSGVEILNHDVRKTPELAIYTEDRDIRFFMRLLPVLWNTTTCYRRDLLLEAGGYREGFEAGAEDYDLRARLPLSHASRICPSFGQGASPRCFGECGRLQVPTKRVADIRSPYRRILAAPCADRIARTTSLFPYACRDGVFGL